MYTIYNTISAGIVSTVRLEFFKDQVDSCFSFCNPYTNFE